MAQRLDANETGGLSPDTFLRLYRELRQARGPMETAVSHYRSAIKRMKDGGVDTFALSVLEKLVKVEEEQAGLHIRNLFRYADWTGANVGLKQPDLFGGADGQAPSPEVTAQYAEQLAEEHGWRTGRAREKADVNPHTPGTAGHAAWARGWHRGQGEEVMAQFGGKAAQPPKEPTRRERNPAAQTREQPPAPDNDGGQVDTGNVVQMPTRGRGLNRRAKAKAPPSPKAARAARKAADKLSGAPVVGDTAF